MADWIDRLRYGNQYGYEVLFRRQARQAAGRPGVIIGDLGMPEAYDFRFYNEFMAHVFRYSLPPFLLPLVMADKGTALIDPDHPLAQEAFAPNRLVDAHGSSVNKAGIPYTDCPVQWRPPANRRNRWDHGYFLYTADGPSGAPDVCEKVGAKISGWYYEKLLVEKKVPYLAQMRRVYEEAAQQLARRFPQAVFRSASLMPPTTLHQAVEELLAAGCQTIIYQGISCPLYTDFEDYGYALPLLHAAVKGRARVIMADQLGSQPAVREAFFQMLCDQLQNLPDRASLLVILSRHGHPFKKETQDARAHLYCDPLEKGVREILSRRGGRWDIEWTFDEYADDYWDPKHTKRETHAAYRRAIQEAWEYAVELPVEFLAENTDLMIFHAMKKFSAFPEYDIFLPISYPDWEKPLVRVFHEGKTTGIYAGCPVGPYRHFVVDAVVTSLSAYLEPDIHESGATADFPVSART